MMPAASVSGIYLAHPEARYFTVGRIGRDQVEDYAARKGVTARRGGALAPAEPRLRAGDRSCLRGTRVITRENPPPAPSARAYRCRGAAW